MLRVRAPCSGPTTPVNLCSFQFGVTPLPTPPPPTQTDLSFGAVPRVVNPQVTDPWSQQFGLGYAWQINNEYAFSADYVHILGTHEERVLNQNPLITNVCDPNYGGNPANPRCVNGVDTRLMDYALVQTGGASQAGRFAQIYDYSTNNRSFYDGINLALRKRMSKRFMFQASDVISWSRAWGGFPVASYGGSGLAVTSAAAVRPGRVQLHQLRRAQPFRLQRCVQPAVGLLGQPDLHRGVSASVQLPGRHRRQR